MVLLKQYFIRFTFVALTSIFFASCLTTQKNSSILVQKSLKNKFEDGSPVVTSKTVFDGKDSVLLTFAGDIMAHTPNTARGHYDKIYEDIEPILKESKLTFANLETPVDNSKPFSTYPEFNVKNTYSDAAIEAGFTVFSLANNHTNDQGLSGIKATQKYFLSKENAKETSRPVYASGVKDSAESPFSYRIINQDGWKILFLAVTELLNRKDYSSYINYIKTDNDSRNKFIEYIKELREKNPCDLFVLGFHSAEPEYILTVEKKQKNYYKKLMDAGVDVLWANHPHVSKDWEVFTTDNNVPNKIIFYSMGNTISAQRTSPTFESPIKARDYTGDGYITQVRFLRETDGSIKIVWVNPILITTYITKEKLFVIKKLDEPFIESLKEQNRYDWAIYLENRKKLMENIKGKTVWQ